MFSFSSSRAIIVTTTLQFRRERGEGNNIFFQRFIQYFRLDETRERERESNVTRYVYTLLSLLRLIERFDKAVRNACSSWWRGGFAVACPRVIYRIGVGGFSPRFFFQRAVGDNRIIAAVGEGVGGATKREEEERRSALDPVLSCPIDSQFRR